MPVLIIVIAVFLQGCSGPTLSAEQAAVEFLFEHESEGRVVIGRSTVEVIDIIDIGSQELVALTFRGTTPGSSGQEACIYVYEADRQLLGGYQVRGGGGMCKPDLEGQDQEPISLSGTKSPGDDTGNPGYSAINGIVNNPEIVQVEVTWEDGTVQQVDVTKKAFVAARAGDHNSVDVIGYNANHEVVFDQ